MNDTQTTNPTSKPSWAKRHPVWTTLIATAVVLLILGAAVSIMPFNVNDTSVSNPAASHDEAIARVEAIRADEEASGELNPVCLTNVMTHGQKTAKVIVFYHGFTSCPEQFRELGQQFFDQGYNVYIPRLPYHGHADQLTNAMLDTSAEELAAFATASLDIAHGLGEEVIVGGLSGGGTIATWIAQQHEDVDQVVVVAPFLGIGFIPALLNRPVARILDGIPNIWMWWDPKAKAENPFTAYYSYPRYPLHALAEYLRLGYAAQQAARSNPPGVRSIVVITNANDQSVNNDIIDEFVTTWQKHGEEDMDTFEFERELNLPHDLITPTREDGNPALVYPIIIDHIITVEQD
ncbi:MAG: alpha/beta fold hydrolase [Ardenticatenaceae bacterium]|nr:alpha/beta fold hydrolase [Ardenticatenaceae bacterium]